MFTILKPEMRRNMCKLDSYLTGGGFNIKSRHTIENWEHLAKQMYAPQREDSIFCNEFDVYLWMTQSLFGNNAILYDLEREGGLNSNLIDLTKIKNSFRQDVNRELDDPLTFMVNIEKIFDHERINIGKRGRLSIGDAPVFSNDTQGVWDNYFFKYIHTPDNPETYRYERGILEKNGIYSVSINEKEWEEMVYLGTMRKVIRREDDGQ
jgi:hypothetical protein